MEDDLTWYPDEGANYWGSDDSSKTFPRTARPRANPKPDKPMKLKLKNVRLSYPFLFTPKENKQNPKAKAKFEASFILDNKANAADIKEAQKIVVELSKDPMFKGKKPGKICLRKGDDTPAREEAEGYGPGVMSISARSERRPAVVDRMVAPITEQDDKIYAGCYVNASLDLFPFIHREGGTMICAEVLAVQFVGDGEPLGNRAPVKAEEEFENISGEDDDNP